MNVKKVLSKLDFLPEKETLKYLKSEAKALVESLKNAIKKEKLDADVFLGGSFAKGTLIKKDTYDIDIFVRFNWRHEDLTPLLARIIKRACKNTALKITRLHGSRDYFRIENGKSIIFEIIPVLRIKKPREARNVTDLSYFHVGYVKKNISKGIAGEIALTKTFCMAHGVYGAESYIQGFSGYGLECLVIYYKTFEKMAKSLAKVQDRIIIDPAKHYKKKEDALFSINESKLHSPIILIDPTWKERNVLAALSHSTFKKFQGSLQEFLNKPSISLFTPSKIDIIELKRDTLQRNAQLLHLKISTNRQPGDIAGTKLKKFANFLKNELSRYFTLLKEEFVYDEEQSADVYFIIRSKKEIIKIGPPISMKKHAIEFKKRNKNVFEKNDILHAKIKLNFSAKEFLNKWKKDNHNKVKEMGITGFDVIKD